MKILIVAIISIIIFTLVFFKHEEHKFTKAVISSCMAAVLGFLGPYIVEGFEGCQISPRHVHEIFSNKKENVLDATCLTAGSYELVSYCDCGEELEREIINVDAMGHSYDETVTNSSCNEPGFTTYKCIRCKDSYVDNYTDVLGHDFIEGVCSRCKTVSPDYEELISSKANEFINAGNYDDALKVVIDAINLKDSESLKKLCNSIQSARAEAANAVVYTASKVNFLTFKDSINGSVEEFNYSMTAPLSGDYRFSLSDMVNGFEVKMFVYDSAGNNVGGYSGIGNNQGVTCSLEKDSTYSIKIASYSGTGNYILTVGQPKENIDVTDMEVIYDSIEYINQWNKYTFIPSISGVYRFDLSDMINGFEVKFFVYDSLGYNVGGYSGVGNGSGITVDMVAGETYTIHVGQYSNLGSYIMSIGKQLSTQDITGERAFSGEITYTNQDNIYNYIPTSSGEHKFTIQNINKGFEVKFFVYDSLGYNVGGYSGVENGGVISANLNANEKYTIHIRQDNNYGSYGVSISR